MGGNSTHSHVDVVKPLFNGCLTGQLHALLRYQIRSMNQDLPLALPKDIPNKTLLKKEFLCGALTGMASLGTFEILRKRLRNGNDGRPLTLYQEGCCGLISGATMAFVWQPFELACNRLGLKKLSYTNWLATLAHIVQNQRVSALWAGSATAMASNAACYAGMLTSYDRSRNYLIETQGLPKWEAQISATIISGLIGTACAHPIPYLGVIIDTMRKARHDDSKRVYESLNRWICKVINPYVAHNFYSEFFRKFWSTGRYCMVQFAIFEIVRGVECSK